MWQFHLTRRAKVVIDFYSQEEAKRLNHDQVTPEHVLLGLLREPESIAIKSLRNLKVDSSPMIRSTVSSRCFTLSSRTFTFSAIISSLNAIKLFKISLELNVLHKSEIRQINTMVITIFTTYSL